MAILIEEQKRSGSGRGAGGLLIWLFALGLIGVAVYYLFFTHPELIELPAPQGFEMTTELSKVDFQVADALKTQISERLKNQVVVSEGGTFGRPNPFIGF